MVQFSSLYLNLKFTLAINLASDRILPIKWHDEHISGLEVRVLESEHALELHVHDARQALLGHRLNRVDRQAKQFAVVRVRLQKFALK